MAARVREVTHGPNPEVVFDLEFFDHTANTASYRGTGTYRSHRVPDLYPVVTATRAIATLMMDVGQSDAPHRPTLIAILRAALATTGQQRLTKAVGHLHSFQHMCQSSHMEPSLAEQYEYYAQGIIDALNAGLTSFATERLAGEYPLFTPPCAVADLVQSVGEVGGPEAESRLRVRA